MNESIIKEKSFSFAIEILGLYQLLKQHNSEFKLNLLATILMPPNY